MATETIEIIETNNYGKLSKYKTSSRDPIKEALNHINNKYFQNPVIKQEVNKCPVADDETEELLPALGRHTFSMIY